MVLKLMVNTFREACKFMCIIFMILLYKSRFSKLIRATVG